MQVGIESAMPLPSRRTGFQAFCARWSRSSHPGRRREVRARMRASVSCLKCGPTARIRFGFSVHTSPRQPRCLLISGARVYSAATSTMRTFLQPEYYWQGQTILKSARFGARDCDVLKSTPGALDRSHYAEVQTWLDHKIGYPIYVEKTLKDGGIVKEFTYFGLSQAGGVWSARQVEVKIHGRPGSTLLIIERGSTKANLSIRDFSPEQISQFEDRP